MVIQKICLIKDRELISKCRHENKFYLNNYETSNKDEPKKCNAHKNGARASVETNGNPGTNLTSNYCKQVV